MTHGGIMERAYQAAARPVLASKGRSLTFLLVTASLSFGSLGLLYTKDVTVKLLPFDNKSELSVIIDLPEGASTEATDRVAQDIAAIVMDLPEVTSVQTHAATAAPFNFNGLVRHGYLRQEPHLGEVSVNLAPKTDATGPAMTSRWTSGNASPPWRCLRERPLRWWNPRPVPPSSPPCWPKSTAPRQRHGARRGQG